MLSRLNTNFDVSSRKCEEEQEREDVESLDVIVAAQSICLYVSQWECKLLCAYFVCIPQTLCLTKCIRLHT